MKSLGARLIGIWVILIVSLTAPGHVAGDLGDFLVFLPLVTTAASHPVGNVVVNGDFEAGQTAWDEVQYPVLGYPLIVHESELPSAISPFDGDWVAWLGGDSELISYIEQVVTVPESSPELTYRHWIDSNPIWACDNGHGGVTVNDVWVDTYWLCDATDTGGWVERTVDLAAYAGQIATLRFVTETTDNYSSLYIDAVSIHPLP